ncbi:YitT family protein [Paenibacillus sp. N1-5-1-14]|uniref:YitT family protein n=1 Tax=Paenibacillus radicibacter TaxID=2972488 RepID=UPI002159AE72|nr:YitT family protein [Paenibacillus radicibacter]MCR8643600.1 YitT family protein [Paenibacillus radicibacter]
MNFQSVFTKSRWKIFTYDVFITIVCGLLVGAGIQLFLTPHHLLSGGIPGLALIANYAVGWDMSLTYFILNLPLIIWGYISLGKKFILLSLTSVLATTVALKFIPAYQVTTDPIIAAIVGGIIISIGVGYSLRVGGSTGGFDIIGFIMTKKRDFPLGNVLSVLNSSIVVVVGFLNSWDVAFYSMLSIYVKGKGIDMIHVRHMKVTAFIVTEKKELMAEELVKFSHGVTMIDAYGCYSHKAKYMLMTVTTRHELPALRKRVLELDSKSFINIVDTAEVVGRFRRIV